ncbi:MAG: YjgN family protein, partial [Pseudomonadota bacterium]|nr:YjgN family protein [Pseudomonadota bacterium]
MSKELYQIVFAGDVLDGFEPADVKANLQALFQLSDPQADKLFGPKPVVIKSGLDADHAAQYLDRLRKAGADAHTNPEIAAAAPVSVSVEQPSNAVNPEPKSEPAPRSGDIRQTGFQFTGSGKEYFGIWIVNILLTIVTLGIYSAWATVRNNQYFYGNTQLEGSSFQYLAKPLTILKGRLIALAVVAVYVVLSNLYVEAAVFFALLFIPAVPWIMIKSLRFNAVNSAYRNVRFDFQGRYGQAFMVTFVWPLLNLLTLLLLTPLVMKKTHEFIASGSRYGTSEFTLDATNAQYYRFFGKGLLIALGFGVGAFLAIRSSMPIVGTVIGIVGYIALFGYFIAGITNLFLSSVQLTDHGFESDLEPAQ